MVSCFESSISWGVCADARPLNRGWTFGYHTSFSCLLSLSVRETLVSQNIQCDLSRWIRPLPCILAVSFKSMAAFIVKGISVIWRSSTLNVVSDSSRNCWKRGRDSPNIMGFSSCEENVIWGAAVHRLLGTIMLSQHLDVVTPETWLGTCLPSQEITKTLLSCSSWIDRFNSGTKLYGKWRGSSSMGQFLFDPSLSSCLTVCIAEPMWWGLRDVKSSESFVAPTIIRASAFKESPPPSIWILIKMDWMLLSELKACMCGGACPASAIPSRWYFSTSVILHVHHSHTSFTIFSDVKSCTSMALFIVMTPEVFEKWRGTDFFARSFTLFNGGKRLWPRQNLINDDKFLYV